MLLSNEDQLCMYAAGVATKHYSESIQPVGRAAAPAPPRWSKAESTKLFFTAQTLVFAFGSSWSNRSNQAWLHRAPKAPPASLDLATAFGSNHRRDKRACTPGSLTDIQQLSRWLVKSRAPPQTDCDKSREETRLKSHKNKLNQQFLSYFLQKKSRFKLTKCTLNVSRIPVLQVFPHLPFQTKASHLSRGSKGFRSIGICLGWPWATKEFITRRVLSLKSKQILEIHRATGLFGKHKCFFASSICLY